MVTPISHIRGLQEKLASAFDLRVLPDPLLEDLQDILPLAEALFTNPNKSRLPIGRALFDMASHLRVVATASTGLTHIDMAEAVRRGVRVVSLTREYATIERISSTAEHALSLTLATLRRVPWAFEDVLSGNWDYEKFIGRQFDALTVGVVGYGRLGKKYARYVHALGARVMVCDPAYTPKMCPFPLVALEGLFSQADVVSLHVHATRENRGLVGSRVLSMARPNLLLVNTARGEIVDERAVADFLRAHPCAMLATDVLANEVAGKWDSLLLSLAQETQQVLVTPHIGGMTREAQEIAYHRAADMLIDSFGAQAARGTG